MFREKFSEVSKLEIPSNNFEEYGGEILEWSEDNKGPVRWRCGSDGNGGLIHPQGIDPEKIISYLATIGENPCLNKGQWHGAIIDHQAVEDIDLWTGN